MADADDEAAVEDEAQATVLPADDDDTGEDDELVPIERFEESDRKDVFKCPVKGCGESALHTTGREFADAEAAREYIEVHIALDHE